MAWAETGATGAGGTVGVWSADLDTAPPELARLLSRLERERAGAIRDGGARRRWIASRAILRLLLAGWTGGPAVGLGFDLGPHGKPRLAGQLVDHVCFSLSHSGGTAVYAISDGIEVGIDVEEAERTGSRHGGEVGIASRFLGEQVAKRIADLPPAERRRELLEAWVSYEARAKCLGLGIVGARLAGEERLAGVWTTRLDLGEWVVGALAVERGPVEVRQRRWNG